MTDELRLDIEDVRPLPIPYAEWIRVQRERAEKAFKKLDGVLLQARFAPHQRMAKTNKELREASIAANRIEGWCAAPIYAEDKIGNRSDGIEYKTSDLYWAIRQSGDFYLLRSPIDGEREPKEILFEHLVRSNAATCFQCVRFYEKLGLPSSLRVMVAVAHQGLAGRGLGSENGTLERAPAIEDSAEFWVEATAEEMRSKPAEVVRNLTAPLLDLWRFEPPPHRYEELVGGVSAVAEVLRGPLGCRACTGSGRAVASGRREIARRHGKLHIPCARNNS